MIRRTSSNTWPPISRPSLPRACRSPFATANGSPCRGERRATRRPPRDVWVCGPGAFVVLKALAFQNRGLPKDAYDLYFIVRYFGANTQEVIARLVPLLDDPEARRAVAVLEADFRDPESTGPRRVAEFLFGQADSETEADVVGFIDLLLLQCRRHDPKS